jgi:hypothetical protein
MAYAQARSCNADLEAGLTDGSYKKAVTNRGGVVESLTCENRREMSGAWHGFNETNPKMAPTRGSVSTINYQYITPEDKENI